MNDETIIYFGPEPWEGMWRNRHQLMSRLARTNKVVYVEPPNMLRSVLNRLSGSKESSIHASKPRLTQHKSGVLVYQSPAWTPLTGRQPFRDLSIRLYMKALRAKCSIEASCKPIIWLSRPEMSDYIGKIHEKLAIYHVVDEYTAYAGVDAETRSWLVAQEQSTMRAADAIVVVTPALQVAKSPYNPYTYLIPNAVNYEAYAELESDAPPDIADIASPIVGFTGLVSARLDFALLFECARRRPDWSFVFVGSINDTECRNALDRLDQLGNVHFLGVRPVDTMPAYLQHFDICTIPYAADDSSANASPLKLYEYAAVRKPIVTTDFAAARDFPGHLQRVTTSDEFLVACDKALSASNSDTTLIENQQFAAANTWEDRVDAVTHIMESHVAKRDEF